MQMNKKSEGWEGNKNPEQADFSIKHIFLVMTDLLFKNISEETRTSCNSFKELE